jgi:hypothetical protein
MTTKKHGGTKTYKYVGTDSDKFVTGNFYSYEDMSKLTGLSEHTLRSRMVKNKLKENGEKVITDLQLVPKRKPFTNLDGTKSNYIAGECTIKRCETQSEIMSNKYLRLPL